MRPRIGLIVLIGAMLLMWAHSGYGQLVPSGTALNVRTTQPIDLDTSHVGMRVTGVVDDPVTVNGAVVVPRGAVAMLEVVQIERSSNLKGRERVTLKVHSIRMKSGTYDLATNHVEVKGPSEGKRATRKIVGGAGIGAALGGILGGGTGAMIGATAGGTTGAVVAGSGKTHLVVPAETLLQFRVDHAARVEP